MAEGWFSPHLFTFLKQLGANNNREWFNANKDRYVELAQTPALEFIEAFAPHLAKISKQFVADPRPSGGSLFRIYRDTRFAHDKTPYKTNIAMHFRHRSATGDVHTPGYYLSLAPGEIECGAGIWRPDASTAAKIRNAIVAKPKEWQQATGGAFAKTFRLMGDSLKRVPSEFDKDHPLGDDLRRKDFVGMAAITAKDVTAKDFLKRYATMNQTASPFMAFLCRATGVPF